MNTADNLALQADPWFWATVFVLYLVMVAVVVWVLKKQYKPSRAGLGRFVLVMLAGFAAFFIAGAFFNIDVLQ